MSEEIHIMINRSRLLFQLILFTVLGISVLIGAFAVANISSINPLIWKIGGSVAGFFFIVAAGSKAKKRADKNAGIRITKEGMIDQSSDLSLGLIKWSDISSIDKEASLEAQLLIVRVKKNNAYLKKAKNSAIERLLKQNIRKFDTPVVIEAGYLECSLEELIDILVEKWNA
jgi:hypothetical protein